MRVLNNKKIAYCRINNSDVSNVDPFWYYIVWENDSCWFYTRNSCDYYDIPPDAKEIRCYDDAEGLLEKSMWSNMVKYLIDANIMKYTDEGVVRVI